MKLTTYANEFTPSRRGSEKTKERQEKKETKENGRKNTVIKLSRIFSSILTNNHFETITSGDCKFIILMKNLIPTWAGNVHPRLDQDRWKIAPLSQE